MKQLRSNQSARVLSLLAIALFILPLNASAAADKEVKVTTAIKYKPIDYFISGKRIRLNAKITDKAGVNLARCYFRAVEEADFVFVGLKEIKTNQYEGILPSPSKDTETIEYLFLAVNGANQVIKSQRFTVAKKDDEKTPAWQEVSSEGDIHVTTELPQATEPPPGFSDSIVVDVAESSARFGLAAGGIYTITAEAGGATGAAASSTSGGSVSSSSGLSTTAKVGIGAAAVAAVGAVIGLAAGSGGSDSSGGGSSGSTGMLSGIWNLQSSGPITGCNASTPCLWDPPYSCGTEICASPNSWAGPVQITVTNNTISGSDTDSNGHGANITGTINGNSVVFTAEGDGALWYFPWSTFINNIWLLSVLFGRPNLKYLHSKSYYLSKYGAFSTIQPHIS